LLEDELLEDDPPEDELPEIINFSVGLLIDIDAGELLLELLLLVFIDNGPITGVLL
tara:strand:+ start:584 stop:751 length:168 start_codon:yes stop_codon:yes gene_type:complete